LRKGQGGMIACVHREPEGASERVVELFEPRRGYVAVTLPQTVYPAASKMESLLTMGIWSFRDWAMSKR